MANSAQKFQKVPGTAVVKMGAIVRLNNRPRSSRNRAEDTAATAQAPSDGEEAGAKDRQRGGFGHGIGEQVIAAPDREIISRDLASVADKCQVGRGVVKASAESIGVKEVSCIATEDVEERVALGVSAKFRQAVARHEYMHGIAKFVEGGRLQAQKQG